jgi:hypothetical protein
VPECHFLPNFNGVPKKNSVLQENERKVCLYETSVGKMQAGTKKL